MNNNFHYFSLQDDLGFHHGLTSKGNNVHVSGSDWTNIIIPGNANNAHDEFHHEKTFLLTDLLPDSQYECLVQAKNRYGWSEASRIHRFNTLLSYSKFVLWMFLRIFTLRWTMLWLVHQMHHVSICLGLNTWSGYHLLLYRID